MEESSDCRGAAPLTVSHITVPVYIYRKMRTHETLENGLVSHQQFLILDSRFPVVPSGFKVSRNLEPRTPETCNKAHQNNIEKKIPLLLVTIPLYSPQTVSGFLTFLKIFGHEIALSLHENRHRSSGFRISGFPMFFFDASEVGKPSQTKLHSC